MQEVVIMKRLIVCLLILFIANVLQAAPVYIPDPNLKAAIEAKLGISNPDANDMLLLTHLDANSLGISDLTGLETATNIRYLRLNLNLISDVTVLSGLTNLWYLNLIDNHVTDISPLQSLTKLIYLYLDRNDNISDINAVKNMNSLAELGLIDVNLVDIAPLADVNQLKYLWLGTNQIQDIDVLRGFYSLIRLNLGTNNPLSFISRCYYLQEIAGNNPTASLTPNPAYDINTLSTDWLDLRIFVSWWLNDTCNPTNGCCYCADMDDSGEVNFEDFAIFADLWMAQP
jgi:Leucine-rich repeat (LRR) protein